MSKMYHMEHGLIIFVDFPETNISSEEISRCLPGGGRISGKEGSCDVTLPTMSSTIQVLVIYINVYQIHENCNGKKTT